MPREVDCGENVDIQKVFRSFCTRVYSNGSRGDEVTESPPFDQANAAAFALALFGWARDTTNGDTKDIVVHCDACFARVGLWMYEGIDESGQSGGGLQPTLCANETHFHDCPWINKRTQEALMESSSAVENHNAAWKALSIFLDRMNGALVPEDESGASAASMDRAMREVADKERFRKVKELTRSFSYKKADRSKGG